MADSESLVLGGHLATWLLANASALGVVYKWLTSPIDAKIANVLEKHNELVKRVEKLEDRFDVHSPRVSMPDAPTLGEVTRRLGAMEEWRREIDAFRSQVVTDEEFRSYTALAGGKIDTILAGIGWIKGRLKQEE